MSRYRPPVPRGSRYITRAGEKRLRSELNELWQERRPAVVQALAAAAAEGDRSENAEYIYRKKQLANIDRRVRYLRKRLNEVRVVDQTPDDPDKIFFGAWVVVRPANESGGNSRYRIVGPDEIDPARGWISIDSPVARALLGHRSGDVVIAERPSGETHLQVMDICYTGADADAAETTTER